MIEQQTTLNHRYRIDRQVGEGGMAVVFAGHDLLLGRDVAIKVARPQYAADPNFRARFEREARAAASFAHQNIIDIFDVGEERGTPFIVMEFVRGKTLKRIIAEEGPFHPDDVAALLAQLGSALDYAHERGYVHRDVKPQNILVDARGQARVVDFGIAKGLADADLTMIGEGLGTAGYLSPEQASGLMATPASDIYSAGVVAFEMLTGALPFAAETSVGVAMRHVHDEPPLPSSLRPGVPPAVDGLVLRALAKDPTKRFASAGEFAAVMANWRSQLDAVSATAARAAAATAVSPVALPSGESASQREKAARGDFATSRPLVGPGTVVRPPGGRTVRATAVAPAPATNKEEMGCATWATGSVILIGLIALVWLGFRMSPRLAGLGLPATTTPLGGVAAPTSEVPGAEISGRIEPPATEPRSATAPGAVVATLEPTPPAPAAITVPALLGQSLPDAEALANGLGLLVTVGEPIVSAEIEVELIAEQDPPSGSELEQQGIVTVRLSLGDERVAVDELALVGDDFGVAAARLDDAGLAVAREDIGSEAVPAGAVVDFSPPHRARRGETVTLRVSVGDKVFLPGAYQGQPLEQVTARLRDLGLEPGRPLGVPRRRIEEQGVDLLRDGIDAGDVVGVRGRGVDFDVWVPRGTAIDVVFYDETLDR